LRRNVGENIWNWERRRNRITEKEQHIDEIRVSYSLANTAKMITWMIIWLVGHVECLW